MKINGVNAREAQELLSRGALFIDVREPEEIDQIAYQVPDVINIPISGFDENYLDIPKDKAIILVCRRGVRSLRVAQFLYINGWKLENLYNLEGGIMAWEADGFPVKKSARKFSFIQPKKSCCSTDDSGSCC